MCGKIENVNELWQDENYLSQNLTMNDMENLVEVYYSLVKEYGNKIYMGLFSKQYEIVVFCK